MRIDAHQHFWRYEAAAYPWIRTPVLKQDYLPPDLRPQLDATGVDGTVAVQARATWAETIWLLELSARFPWIRGVVGWADLTAPDLLDHLAPLKDASRLSGIRCGIVANPDDATRPSRAFLTSLSVLTELHLAFDLLLRPPQLTLARNTVAAAPEQRFVLDHIAKPLIKDQVMVPWATEIRALAAHPNVACKLSGMVTEADHLAWRRQDFVPYLDIVLEAFGPDRLMIGSDWPVCRQAADYGRVLSIVQDYAATLSPSERDAILGGTAIQWYRLQASSH